MLLLSSAYFFKKNLSGLIKNTIRVSNSLDPDQDLHYVGPDLGPNCFPRISADGEATGSKERVNP